MVEDTTRLLGLAGLAVAGVADGRTARDPVCTYWYLSAAPELLALAAGRLQAAQEARP